MYATTRDWREIDEAMPKTFKSAERRHPLNVRTTKDVREQLEAAARASGRSLTQELEIRLEQSLNPWVRST